MVLDQELEQLELPAGQAQPAEPSTAIATASKSAVRCAPWYTRAEGTPVLAAAEHRPHARGELAQAERLGDVVVCAEVEPGHPVGLGVPPSA